MRNRDIRLRKYCDANFREMDPDTETGRICERCETEVKDLSAMNADEARAVLERGEGHVCVRFLYDEDGDVVFKDRPPKIIPPTWLVRSSRAMIIAATALSPAMLESCGPQPSDCADHTVAGESDTLPPCTSTESQGGSSAGGSSASGSSAGGSSAGGSSAGGGSTGGSTPGSGGAGGGGGTATSGNGGAGGGGGSGGTSI